MATTSPASHSPLRLPHLALTGYLPYELVMAAAREAGWHGRLRKYDPWLCRWGLVAQALWANAAQFRVGALLAAASGIDLSPGSGAFCRARRRLSVGFLVRLVGHLAGLSREQIQPGGPRRLLLDGGCLGLLDSAANQARFPQSKCHKPGCGFPRLHFVALLDLDTGALVDARLGPLDVHDAVLARPLWDVLRPGDLIIADRGFSGWGFRSGMDRREVYYVVRQNGRRRNLTPLPGRRDHRREHWARPKRYPDWWDADGPAELAVRVVRERLSSTTTLVLNTNLPASWRTAEVVALYRARWRVETRFLEFKVLLAAEPLRAKHPATAEQVFWAWVIAYNLVCCLLCETAREHGQARYRLSCGAALDALAAAPLLAEQEPERCGKWVRQQIAGHLLPRRRKQHRDEPRALKQWHRAYSRLTKPREKYREHGRSRVA